MIHKTRCWDLTSWADLAYRLPNKRHIWRLMSHRIANGIHSGQYYNVVGAAKDARAHPSRRPHRCKTLVKAHGCAMSREPFRSPTVHLLIVSPAIVPPFPQAH